MSTAAVKVAVEQPQVEEPKALSVVPGPGPVAAVEKAFSDQHPAVVVGTAMAIALIGAVAFVGSILLWLVLRNTGIGSPVW